MDGAVGGADVMGTNRFSAAPGKASGMLSPPCLKSQRLSLCGPAPLRWPGVPSTDLLTPGLSAGFPLEVSFPATIKGRKLQMQRRFLSILKMIALPMLFGDVLLLPEGVVLKFAWTNQSFAYFDVKNEDVNVNLREDY